jgi:hypothetical protein
MSGGSFNYLYRQTLTEACTSYTEDLREMVAHLRELDCGAWGTTCPDAGKAADELAALLEAQALLEQRYRAMERILWAAEWYRSGDWPAEEVTKAIEAWKATRGTST